MVSLNDLIEMERERMSWLDRLARMQAVFIG